MSLAPGTALGPYRVEEVLGSGGMGEVYRAIDTRLERHVAIKVLAAQFASSEMMRQRFDAEARTISSLNHPGICHLYDIGHEQGYDFIVMEFLDGDTLAERIDGGPMPMKDLLRMAVELTDALDAAHRSGVIHRDLKPGNVMLTANGAKLMDFGLAKLAREPELLAQTVAAGDSETKLAPLTNPGSAVGTIAYMSPEQARGDELDPRTDLFSLGAVLYECATGRRAFPGKTSAVVFHAILAEAPPPLEAVAPETPHSFVDLVERLLEKDPDLRPQSAGEVRAWLKRVQRDIGEPSSHHSTPILQPVDSSARYKHFARTFALVGGLVIVIIGAIQLWRYFSPKPQPPMITSINPTPLYEQVTQLGNVLDGAAISPDGKYVAYVTSDSGARTIWIRQIATNSAVALAKEPYGESGHVSFSPDSQYVYFSHSKSERDFMPDVYVVPVLGGETRKILSNVESPVGVARNGKLAYIKFDMDAHWGLYIADPDGSNEHRVSVEFITSNSRASWSPDGKKIAVSGRDDTRAWQIAIVDAETGTSQRLGDHHWDFVGSPAWLPDGSGLITSGASGTFRDQLWLVSYPAGEVRPLTNDLNNYGDLAVTISDDGNSLLAVQMKQSSNLWEYSLRSRETRRLTSGTAMDGVGGISVAPDGRIFYGTSTGKDLQIWMLSADGSQRRQISRGTLNVFPAVSRDGSRVVYYSFIGNNTVVVSSDLEGTATTSIESSRKIDLPFEPWLVQDRVSFSLDSKSVYLCTVTPQKMGIWQIPLEGNSAPVHYRAGTYMAPSISPDGKLMKTGMFDERTNQLIDVVFPMDGSAPPKTVLVGPGKPLLVQWTPDGKGLSYIAEENGIGNIYYQPWPSGQYRKLTSFDSDTIFYYDWAPGNRLIVSRGTPSSDLVLLTNLRQK